MRRSPELLVLGALIAAVAASRTLEASDVPPWRDHDDLPIQENARSVIPLRAEVPILREPSALAERRGTAFAGTRLPLYGAKRASGCAARWINIGPWAWICQDAVAIDAEDPVAAVESGPTPSDGLPYRYYYAARDGARGYSRLEDAEEVAPDREFDSGFAVAIVEEAVHAGQRYGHTHHGLWIPLRELIPVVASTYRGEELADGKLDFGWVIEERAVVFPSLQAANASGAVPKAKGMRSLARFERISILEEGFAPKSKTPGIPTAFRIGDEAWVRTRDVARPSRSDRPEAVQSGERWIDVDLRSQTLVAYEGDAPVFATLVSTGRGHEGTESATPKGERRIWVKLLSSNMDNLEDETATHSYAIEDVPYVQYFANGVGLHGAFWHQGFGHVRSHGCVNLSPLDAQRLFRFTRPPLPSGWSAILPTPNDPGTLVRVR